MFSPFVPIMMFAIIVSVKLLRNADYRRGKASAQQQDCYNPFHPSNLALA
jgi:hypothetical protein